MRRKLKTICFVGQNRSTCDYISRQLNQLLANHVNVVCWCLQDNALFTQTDHPDLFLISSNAVLNKVQGQLAYAQKIMVADRALNTENLDRLIGLKRGMSIVVVGSSQETSELSVEILHRYGFGYLTMTPWWPGKPLQFLPGTNTAVTMGLSHLVPESIRNTIDLGTRSLSIKTFRELIDYFNLPENLLNEVSRYYIRALLNLSLRKQKIAELNEHLKYERDVILNTISEALIAVNQNNSIVLFNPASEAVFHLKSELAIRKNAADLFPQIDFAGGLYKGKEYKGEIIEIRGSYFVLETRTTKYRDAITGVVATLHAVSRVQELEARVRTKFAQKGQVARYRFDNILGVSKKLKEAIALSKRFAKSDLTILLEAESGCGKEVLAQSIHNYSNRSQGPFIAINFAALPENLVESELFGYERGAFSGANQKGKAGLFEAAHTGTIFLDEIGDASGDVQKKLLRVLEEREVRRVGGDSFIPVDVRVISATNRDLKKLVDEGEFRVDLFYRLNALPIILPPLRERSEDIFLLCDVFSELEIGYALAMSAELKGFFSSYNWPGNIRELQNVVRYICHSVPPGTTATCEHLPGYLLKTQHDVQSVVAPNHSHANAWETVISEIQHRDLLSYAAGILKEIKSTSTINRTIGRRALANRLRQSDRAVSEHKVRACLDILRSQNFVHCGITRQGCRITESGIQFLQYIETGSTSQN